MSLSLTRSKATTLALDFDNRAKSQLREKS
jgi:hypothetical protein